MANITVTQEVTEVNITVTQNGESYTLQPVLVVGGGGGDVTSVNGQTGVVVLLTDDIPDTGQTNKYTTQADIDRLSNTSGTNTGDQILPTNTSDLVNDGADGVNPFITAADIPADAVTSVNGEVGVVVLDTDDIADTATNRYTNDTDITRLANTSGTNTGDQGIQQVIAIGNTITNLNDSLQLNARFIEQLNPVDDTGFLIETEGFSLTNGVGNTGGRSGVKPNFISVGNLSFKGNIFSTNITSNRSYQLPNKAGTFALLDDLTQTTAENLTMTGTVDLDLATFDSFEGLLTGNTTITVSNTPASGQTFVKNLRISGDTGTETLTLPVGWTIYGEYKLDMINKLTVEFANFATVGLKVDCFINQPA